MRQGDLAGLIGIESHSLSRIVHQLQVKGLLDQRDDASDRRVKVFELTESGSRLAVRIDEDLSHMRLRVLQAVPASDVREVVRILGAVEKGLLRDEIQMKSAAGR